MKKVTTLLFVLVFASSMAFAQDNSATTSQTGDDNQVTIDQNNYSNSGGHVADVSQDGDENNADVMSNGYFTPNMVNIDQIGDKNETKN